MSKYLDQYLNQAMWEAHNKKCFYCVEPLTFKNIHVDHIIPKAAFVNEEKTIREKYSLDDSFNFNSVDNFVPSCQSCNAGRKGSKELLNGIPLWLDENKKKKDWIIKRATDLKSQLSLDLPDQYKEFFVSSPDFMLSELSVERIRKTDIPLYKNLAFSQNLYPLHLTSPDDESIKVLVTNLSQYKLYSDKGYYGYTTPEIGLCSVCDACLILFEKFEVAFTCKNMLNFRDHYRSLPATTLDVRGPDGVFDFKDYNTIGEYIDAKDNVIEDVTSSHVKIIINHKKYNEQEIYIMQEVLQADFSGNGNNESIIFVYLLQITRYNALHVFNSGYVLKWKISNTE